jgi:hypothetical protein
MLDESAAREIARTALPPGGAVLGPARELDQGWFFPYVTKDHDAFDGVIVHKKTGRPLSVPVESPMARNPALYDRGYQFLVYDLVVLGVEDVEETVRLLLAVSPKVQDTYYKFGRVYRVGRGMTETEIRESLQDLPAVFNCMLAYQLDKLEHAREAGWFTFKVMEYRPKQ